MKQPIHRSCHQLQSVARIFARALLAIVIGCPSPMVLAQVRLPNVPNVQVPQIPAQLPLDPSRALNAPVDALDRRLQDVRRLRIRELLRTNRQVLEADPNGAPMIRNEIVAYSPNDASMEIARNLGMTIVRQTVLEGLDVTIVVFAPRTGTSTRTALRRLQRADPAANYDFNHVYVGSGAPTEGTNTTIAHTKTTAAHASVGLIDAGVDTSHPSLNTTQIHRWGCNDSAVPAFHGTAVASLLVGNANEFAGASPGAALYAADVYCGKPTGGAVDTIAAAFAWLAKEKVAVINVSLVGPPNVLLEKIVATMLARGHVIVAAVGNDGPAAPPLYPASYPGVVGVTGVDDKRRVLLEAAQGKQVFFAAPGADMAAANFGGGFVAVRGTSFAAPIVAGLLAQYIALPDPARAKEAIEELASSAIDLGPRGVDKIYGRGLLGDEIRVALQPLIAHPAK